MSNTDFKVGTIVRLIGYEWGSMIHAFAKVKDPTSATLVRVQLDTRRFALHAEPYELEILEDQEGAQLMFDLQQENFRD